MKQHHVMRLVVTALLTVGCATGAVAAASAEEPRQRCPICRRANDQRLPYPEKAGSTLVRGAVNTAFGWTELLVQPTAEVNAGGNVLFGIGKGVGYAVKRTAGGISELLTFWTPKSKAGYLSLVNDCPICVPAATPKAPPSAPPSSSDPSSQHP